jgi:hypothetical protein
MATACTTCLQNHGSRLGETGAACQCGKEPRNGVWRAARLPRRGSTALTLFNRVVAKAHRRSTGTRTWRKGAGAIRQALGRLQRLDGGRDARSRRALASEWVGRWCSTARHVVVGRQSSRGAVQRRSQRASSAGSCTRASGASLALVDATAIAVAQARPRLVHFPALRALSSARRASLHPLLMQFAAFGARTRRQLHASQLCASGAG